MTLVQTLGEFVAGLDTARIPAEVLEKARAC